MSENKIPWEWIKEKHIEEHGYSGSLIRVLRIKNNYTRRQLAAMLKKSKYTLNKLESTDRIGIKVAKDLAAIFKLDDWRILREKSFYLKNKK